MNQVFWIGVYPGLSREMLDYVIDIMKLFVKKTNSGDVLFKQINKRRRIGNE